MTAIPDPTVKIETGMSSVAPCTQPGCTEKRPHVHKDTLPYNGRHLIEDDDDHPH